MIELLKQQVLKKYGNPVNSAKDCSLLTNDIANKSSRTISEASLRRFLGLLASNSSLSKYNLDTLSIYCGYTDLVHFNNKNTTQKASSYSSNSNIQSELKKLSTYTLKSIERKSLSKYNTTIPRLGVNNNLDEFLESTTFLYPLVAPGGFGKSIALSHWVRTVKTEYILFCNAEFFHRLITNQSANGRQLDFDLESVSNVFNQILEDNKIVIIIDDFDAIVAYNNKAIEIIDYVETLYNKYGQSGDVKVIVGMRDITWNNIVLPAAKSLTNNSQDFTIQNNILKLSSNEIQAIINKTNTVVFNSLSWYVKELITVPLNLHIFLSVYNDCLNFEEIPRTILFKNYFNKIIFTSKYAEQKEDILWAMLEDIESEKQGFYINKTSLKQIYPIHLKRETEYYQAYQNLLYEGIINEERIENKYGIFITLISFKHLDFYYYLSALYLVRANNGIDAQLFTKVSEAKNTHEWKVFVLTVLYEMAYSNESFEAIKDFCNLPERLISSIDVRMAVGSSFRTKNNIRNLLIDKYATSRIGQTCFFEQFVDTNYLFNNYEYRITAYLKNKKGREAMLFGNNILFTARFLQMDASSCKSHFDILSSIEVDNTIHPWPIGRRTAAEILYQHFIIKDHSIDYKKLIEQNKIIANAYLGSVNKGVVEYELMIMVALSLIGDYDTLLWMLIETNEVYHFTKNDNGLEDIIHSGQNSLPKIFKEYAAFKLNKEYSEKLPELLIAGANRYYSNMDDFQYRILIYWFLCDYYWQQNDSEKSLKYWQSAFDLSNSAEYKFYLLFLLINKPTKTEDDTKTLDDLLSTNSFNLESFKP